MQPDMTREKHMAWTLPTSILTVIGQGPAGSGIVSGQGSRVSIPIASWDDGMELLQI